MATAEAAATLANALTRADAWRSPAREISMDWYLRRYAPASRDYEPALDCATPFETVSIRENAKRLWKRVFREVAKERANDLRRESLEREKDNIEKRLAEMGPVVQPPFPIQLALALEYDGARQYLHWVAAKVHERILERARRLEAVEDSAPDFSDDDDGDDDEEDAEMAWQLQCESSSEEEEEEAAAAKGAGEAALGASGPAPTTRPRGNTERRTHARIGIAETPKFKQRRSHHSAAAAAAAFAKTMSPTTRANFCGCRCDHQGLCRRPGCGCTCTHTGKCKRARCCGENWAGATQCGICHRLLV